MATQRLLFVDHAGAPRPTARGLVLRAQPRSPLNKKQQAFNRLVGTVEKLRANLGRDRARLDGALVFHAEHVYPRVQRVVAMRKDVVRALRPFLEDRRLKRGDKRDLRAVLAEQLDDVLQHDGVLEDDLRALFGQLHGTDFEELERAEMDEARSAMEAVFADMGLDLDLSALRPGMSDEELAAKTAELTDAVRRQAEEAESRTRPGRRETAREHREEERARRSEDLRKTSLSGIYRQLAKVLHPDLERDPDVRQRKSALMQELTAAYAGNDLHTLLRLQLEWMHREESDAMRLTGETLDAYNQLLKEQVAELQAARAELPHHPRYLPLVREVGPFGVHVQLDGPAEVRRLDGLLADLADSLARLQAEDALDEVRDTIEAHRWAVRVPY